MRARKEGGQSLVEFALVLPIFLVLIFGVIDGGRAIFAYNQMSQVTRAVARVASTTCFEKPAAACDRTSESIASSIASQGAGYQSPVTWTITCVDKLTGAARTSGANSCRVGDLVRVAVSSSFSPITPIVSSFGTMTLGSTTEQEILQ